MRDGGPLAECPRDLLCCPLPSSNRTDDLGGEALCNLQLFGSCGAVSAIRSELSCEVSSALSLQYQSSPDLKHKGAFLNGRMSVSGKI
ncbi:hypothetical protein KC351_g10 [Hortaea werneckii]|nr:hypothetical protein KC351_g10 [Hortaea werneckii]